MGSAYLKNKEKEKMAVIKIGADEIILWLRKNGRAATVPNDDLGKNICDLICNMLGGQKNGEAPVRWDTRIGADHVDPLDLPKTAEQYTLDTKQLDALYQAISTW
jgi:hypothetical protein